MAATKKSTAVQITAPKIIDAEFTIRGTAPLVIHAFGSKARSILREQHEAGSQAKKGKKKKEPRNFDSDFKEACHTSEDGWYGIPASAFRSAMIRACSLVGFTMVQARMSVFIKADGVSTEGDPLVRIDAPDPEMHIGPVRNSTGVVDLRARPMWREWKANLTVQFDEEQFKKEDVANLLMRAGIQVGICEGRPSSKASNGCGWGTFAVN